MMSSSTAYPWFRLSKQSSGWKSDGRPNASTGHILPRDDGRPDGIYWQWQWDGQRLRVENDRYGFAPLFYYCSGEEFIISPSVVRLIALGAPRKIDIAAMAVFSRMGFFYGDDTPFEQIRAFPANATAVWDNGRFDISGALPNPPLQHLGKDQAVDGFIDLFRQAMARRPPVSERTVIPLSGGMDSRYILFESLHQGRPPREAMTTVRWRFEGDEDLKIAQQICRTVGVRHRALRPSEALIKKEVTKNLLSHLMSDEHTFFMAVSDACLGNVDTIYDGIAGDVLSDPTYAPTDLNGILEHGRVSEVAEKVIRYGDVMDRIFADYLGITEKKLLNTYMDKTCEEITKYKSLANPIGMFYFWTRTRREIATAPFGLFAHVPVVYAPYVDHDVFDFLASFPLDLTFVNRGNALAIAKAFPDWADIPYAWSIAAPSKRHQILSVLGLLDYSLRHAPRFFPSSLNVMLRQILGHLNGGHIDFNWRMFMHLFQLDWLCTGDNAKDALALLEESRPVFAPEATVISSSASPAARSPALA